jgi:hypothetical protein
VTEGPKTYMIRPFDSVDGEADLVEVRVTDALEGPVVQMGDRKPFGRTRKRPGCTVCASKYIDQIDYDIGVYPKSVVYERIPDYAKTFKQRTFYEHTTHCIVEATFELSEIVELVAQDLPDVSPFDFHFLLRQTSTMGLNELRRRLAHSPGSVGESTIIGLTRIMEQSEDVALYRAALFTMNYLFESFLYFALGLLEHAGFSVAEVMQAWFVQDPGAQEKYEEVSVAKLIGRTNREGAGHAPAGPQELLPKNP